MKEEMGKRRNKGNCVKMERISIFNKAITVQVTYELHSEIKRIAVLRNIPISRWVTRAIVVGLKKEKEHKE